MKNVLLIFYYFPPAGGSGVQRGLKFAKYLPEFGFRPVILCADSRFLKHRNLVLNLSFFVLIIAF